MKNAYNHESHLVKEIIFIAENSYDYLNAGEYAFPFRFEISQNIPSSFKNADAHTQYSIVSVLRYYIEKSVLDSILSLDW